MVSVGNSQTAEIRRGRPAPTPLCGFSRITFTLAVAASLAVTFTPIAAGDKGSGIEYKIKGGYLFNFLKFVEWPEGTFADARSPFVVGVVDDGGALEILHSVLDGKSLLGRRIVLTEVVPEQPLVHCQVLFFTQANRPRAASALAQLETAPILVIGESEGFVQNGGVVNFVKRGDNVRFELNLQAARVRRLKISSQLAGLAELVVTETDSVR